MTVLPRTRRIEEILTNAQVDPRLAKIIIDLAERQRVQHQQIYEFAKLFVSLQEFMLDMSKKLAIRDGNLEKLGVREMLTNLQSKNANFVSSVEEFDQETSAHNDSREKKN